MIFKGPVITYGKGDRVPLRQKISTFNDQCMSNEYRLGRQVGAHVWFSPTLPLKKHCMQEGPRVEICPIAIQFLGTYVIVMGVSNLPGNIEMEIFSVIFFQLALW